MTDTKDRAREIGEQPAYLQQPTRAWRLNNEERPVSSIVFEAEQPGMSYRQWLIGRALGGLCANDRLWSVSGEGVAPLVKLEKLAAIGADAVLQRLAEEESGGGDE